ncbi:MAG TPA: flagellar hook-length control protein FliK [Rhabdaerophilum sp.]|nr:flagellar hook-length control protein FliK [Rhabdaerophilum sp.]
MPSALASIAGKAQEIRAQSLSTLMATLDAVKPISAISGALADGVQGSMQSAEAAIRAVLIEAQPNGKALMQIAGLTVEADLPPELQRAAASNPGLLRPGTTLLLPANTLVRPAQEPATLVQLTHTGVTGPSVGAPPPLANPFPPGSLGAAIAKIAGLAFPIAEPAASVSAFPQAITPTPVRSAPLAQPLPAELAAPVLQAAARQVPVAVALTQLLAAPASSMPEAVGHALTQLAAIRANPEALRTLDGLREAVAKSGAFLEANLAASSSGSPPPPADLKAVLLALRALLAGNGPEELPLGKGLERASPETTQPRTPAQPGAEAPPRNVDLARLAEGAVERIKLAQLASLPDHPEMRVTDDRAQGMRLAISIPLATQGADKPPTAIMGLVIEHQPPGPHQTAMLETEREANGETEPFPWKVRIALDLEETGPVQAEVALRGQSVAVTLWAERQTLAQAARHAIGDLHDALTGAAFDVVKLEIRDGRPQPAPPRHGPLLDRLT